MSWRRSALPLIAVIRSGLQRCSDEAAARFHCDRIQALIAEVDCAGCGLQDRNHGVLALEKPSA